MTACNSDDIFLILGWYSSGVGSEVAEAVPAGNANDAAPNVADDTVVQDAGAVPQGTVIASAVTQGPSTVEYVICCPAR